MQGAWAPRFAPLVEAFAQSVRDGGERGSIAVAVDGEVVVEAWGGLADPVTGRAWSADTLACCFSVTKGVVSLLAQRLVDTGRLDLERPVADYWPEFGQAGKAAITVLDLLTHRAGLPAVSGAVRAGSLYDWEAMTALLAASAPVVAPRGAPVYHNMTYGHLVGEVMLRATGGGVADRVAGAGADRAARGGLRARPGAGAGAAGGAADPGERAASDDRDRSGERGSVPALDALLRAGGGVQLGRLARRLHRLGQRAWRRRGRWRCSSGS